MAQKGHGTKGHSHSSYGDTGISLIRIKQLFLLASPLSYRQIAKRLNIHYRSVLKARTEFIKKGYLRPNRTLTALGKRALKTVSIGYDLGAHSLINDNYVLDLIQKYIRHKVIRFFCEVKYKLRQYGDLPKKYTGGEVRVFKTWELKGGAKLTETKIDNIRVRVTPKHVIMIPPELYGDDPMSIKDKAWLLCESIIPKVEAWFNVEVDKRPNKIYMTFSKQHFAFMNNAIARYAKDPSRKWDVVIHDKEDGKARIVIDASKGFPELEAVHPVHAEEDAEVLKRLIEDYTLRGAILPRALEKRLVGLEIEFKDYQNRRPSLPKWFVG